ncbi:MULTISPECIES: sugar diacid recognition domain-containing protein [unclassified Aliivibrio]|jgi:carbohydrate diacid regulator|uniref:sugar diacid recognition domain-containing protein n=1 Tax=unclassified Aliivibrio TaxID=2645654 RepID=UPI00080E3B7C|nr:MULTISPECIES: sugar diacid recognition domain-containing protein [unclassified Aliivibrio]OCH14533.1 XRE family transcriptional regulator [Aliivibrio sp. 1S128]OCH16973.1 XRE family transcriptional regulator [Aliivibrio sp. 1S165]OCH33405.1 XRE family transcriptional regulator [Aliivibrio sp. 1S175]
MQLTTMIAKQIVERTMKIIKHSVNVMDEYGVIIGSGDPARLNCRHEGAILAINENRIVEIDHSTAQQLRGVKAGINLPIIFQNNVIGVVGISGELTDIQQYGELVKMTAELIIEQAALMTEIQWSKRHKEELVLQLIQPSDLNTQQLYSIAERLELDLNQPRIATIIKVDSFNGENLSLTHLQKLVHLLEFPERDNLVAISSVTLNEVVVLKPITLTDTSWNRSHEEKRIRQLFQRISHDEKFTIKIALGDYFPNLEGLAQSYMTAKATMRTVNTKSRILFYQDNILPVLIDGLQSDTWRAEQLILPIKKLTENDTKGILLKTLRTFFNHNCDSAQTCKVLHIHRNTLRYRLDKIEKETSLDINKIKDKTYLYLSVLAYK